MRLLRVLACISLTATVSAALACQSAPHCGSTPCQADGFYAYSPCGFKNVSSTCSRVTDAGPIRGAAGETCTVTVTYGDGTTATTTLEFGEGDDCCPGVRLVRENPLLSPPSRCFADAGADVDAGTDAPTDAVTEAAIDP